MRYENAIDIFEIVKYSLWTTFDSIIALAVLNCGSCRLDECRETLESQI